MNWNQHELWSEKWKLLCLFICYFGGAAGLVIVFNLIGLNGRKKLNEIWKRIQTARIYCFGKWKKIQFMGCSTEFGVFCDFWNRELSLEPELWSFKTLISFFAGVSLEFEVKSVWSSLLEVIILKKLRFLPHFSPTWINL